MSLLRMELNFNDKITGKLQNHTSSQTEFVSWPRIIMLQTTKHLNNRCFKVLSCYFYVSLNYLVAVPHCLNFNRFRGKVPLQQNNNKLLTSDVLRKHKYYYYLLSSLNVMIILSITCKNKILHKDHYICWVPFISQAPYNFSTGPWLPSW